jgi:hypothetical protein
MNMSDGTQRKAQFTVPTPTAEDVGARPETWMPTAEEVGARPASWTPTAEEVGATTQEQVNEAVKEAVAPNLLDNSNFSNFVALAGINGMHGNTKFPMDRWISWDKDITVGDGYIIPGSPIDQRVSLDVVDVNKKYTVAVCLDDGTIVLRAGLFTETFGSTSLPFYCYAPEGNNYVVVRLGTGNRIRWAALYEGEYTSETLPKYHPMRYGEELAECQRHCLPLKEETIYAGYIASDGKQIWLHIPVPSTMRVTPTFTFNGKIGLRLVQSAWNLENWTVSAVYNRENGVVLVISQNESTFTAGTVCSAYFAGTASLVADI